MKKTQFVYVLGNKWNFFLSVHQNEAFLYSASSVGVPILAGWMYVTPMGWLGKRYKSKRNKVVFFLWE